MALIAAKVIGVPLAFDPFAGVVFDLPKATTSRALLYPLVATILAYLVVHSDWRPRWSRLHTAVVALLAAYLLATLTAVHFPTALFGAPGRYLGLVTLFDNVALAAAVAIFVRTRRDVVVIGATLVVTAALVVGYSLVQVTGHDPIPWDQAAIYSTLGNAAPFSGFLLTTTAALAAYVLSERDSSWLTRIGLGSFCVVSVAIIVLRGSRISALALVPVALALALLVYRVHAARLLRLRRWQVSAGMALLTVAAAAALFATPLGPRLVRAVTEGDQSFTERLVIYRAAFEAVRERPLLGDGPDNFVAVFPTTRGPEPLSVAVFSENSTHSWLLKTATDAGIVGLGAFIALVTCVLAAAWRVSGEGDGIVAVAGVAVVAFLAQGIVSISHIGTEWLLWLAIGLIAAAPIAVSTPGAAVAGQPRKRLRREVRIATARRRAEIVIGLPALAVGLFLSTTAFHSVEASRLSKFSLGAVDRNDGGRAVAAALEATRKDAGRGDPWNALGVSYDFVGRVDLAIASFRRAVAVEPYTRIYITNLAEEELKLYAAGHPEFAEPAIRDAKAAVELAPTDPYSHYSYARILNIVGGHEKEAAERADRAAELVPDDQIVLELAVTTQQRAGNLARAIQWQQRVVALGGSLPARLRLARLYLATGDSDAARAQVGPPRIAGVDRDCNPQNGVAASADGRTSQRRCFRVFFSSEDSIQTDPSRSDSVLRPENYAFDGRTLPTSTVISYDPVQAVADVQLPANATPPGEKTMLVLRRIANALGFPIQPDPTTIQLN